MAAATLVLAGVAFGPSLLRPLGGGSLAGAQPAPRISVPLPAFPALVPGASGMSSARLRQAPPAPDAPPARHAAPRAPSAHPPSAHPPSTAPAAAPSPAMTPAAMASPSQPVVVRYTVDARSGSGFRGEIDVGNNGSVPLAGWQIVVALPDDWITSFQDASGYVSHHVMLLRPAPSAPEIAPGSTLRVFFAAQGTETTPELCAFNDIACG